MADEQTTASLAASFDSAAETYQQARPGYPDEAVDWLLAAGPRQVLDLGAGTGKLTRSLAGRVATLYAVDPGPRMLAQLTAVVPQAIASVGSAEPIPLPDACVDAVLVAQAWHWVDPDRAIPEVRRVLRPGGELGLIWNVRDESVPWVSALTAIIHGSGAEQFVAEGVGSPAHLGPAQRRTFGWKRPFTRQSLLELVRSRSYLITAPAAERDRILAQVSNLLDTHPDLADPDGWLLPYRTVAFRIAVA